MRLIIATKNRNKLKEIKKILKGLNIELLCLADLRPNLRIKEDGKTFFDNALKKAKAVSKIYKDTLVLGEDSGIEVEYLGGKPGVLSKRFSGKNSNDHKNNFKLLKLLKNVPFKKRKAQFRCTIALTKNKKLIAKFEGKLCGYINDKAVGKNGFGYDPVFYLPRYKKTVAQLPLREKNKISHRAKAFYKLKKFLAKYIKNK